MYESLFKNPLHRVFVYGTLKRGEPNHRVIQNATDGYAKFLGLGKTVNKYPLVIATKYNIPFLLKKPGTGNQILGEVYDVDTKMLAKLDELEEHPSFYVRTEEDVLLAPTANLKPDINFEESVQTKTFRGQCPVTLNPRERKDPPNTMASLDSRFDKDSEYAELGSSGLRQLTKQLDIKQEELGPNVTEEGTIEFLDEQDYDLLQYLKMAQNLKVPEVASVSSEKSSNTNRTHIIKKISTVDSDHGNITQKEMDAKFILKNQQAKTTANPCIIQENLQLRNDILVLQKNLLAQEMKAKAEINKLTIENLKLDLQIKQMTQQKLEANIIDDDCNL